MKNVHGLEKWKKDKNIPDSKRFFDITISIKYPDQELFRQFEPKERIKKIDQYYDIRFKQITGISLLDSYEPLGTEKRPTGVKTKINYSILNKLSKLTLSDGIGLYVETVSDAIKIEDTPQSEQRFYAIKMTVVIEIEGVVSKKQSIEERIVVIRATSQEGAYEKLEKNKNDYAEPYLNSDGRFVRWRIESFDDCYDTYAIASKDFDNPDGVEVYSKLKSRKSKQQIPWDGKS